MLDSRYCRECGDECGVIQCGGSDKITLSKKVMKTHDLQRKRMATQQHFPDSGKMFCNVVLCHQQQNVGEINIQEGHEKTATTGQFQ